MTEWKRQKNLPLSLLFFTLLVLTNSLCIGATQGPAGHWRFDEVQGWLTPDASGNQNHGRVLGATRLPGIRGAGLHFDSAHKGVMCTNVHSLNPTDAVTIEAWVRPGNVNPSAYATIVRKENAYALRFNEGRLGMVVWIDGEPILAESDILKWGADRWYHVAGTYDGSRVQVFVDGSQNGSAVAGGPIDSSNDACWIGSWNGDMPLGGTLDEVKLHARALSQRQISESSAAGRRALGSNKHEDFESREIHGGLEKFRKPQREIQMGKKGFIWVDAEDFQDYGGWRLDTQFVHLMGSAYLIAAGTGKPVEDATATVDIPHGGTYRIWVRTKNWLQNHSPGRFSLIVDGKKSDRVFGTANTEKWTWRSAGQFRLTEGKTTISLHDLTGYYGRCDALILTTDMNYTPPDELDELNRERARLTGLSLEPKPAGDYDVIVVGAGAAGCCAALASARMGAKTALIQNRPVLGGNASVELGVHICGASVSHSNARESGIIEEMNRLRVRYGFPKMSGPFHWATSRQENLTVFLNTHVFDVEMDDEDHIEAVRAIDTLTNGITIYRGKFFIDCTGDGWVGYFADAEYRLGRESQDEFNESLAPEESDDITMSGCIMDQYCGYQAEDIGKPVEYTAPDWAPSFPSAEEFGRRVRGVRSGNWWLEHEGAIDDIWNAEKARDELIRISFGYWDYVKNTWADREKAATYRLAEVPITEAKRESRRLIGDYILTQNDVQSARMFPDRISYGGWPLDVHHPEGIYSGPEGPFDFNPHVPIYSIPYRCLYSVNIENLLFAGRDVSVTHVALGSVRVQATLSTLGQAAGTAAALCLEHDTKPRGIYRDHMRELQQTLLKHDQYIPGMKNQAPADLARTATVTASSTATREQFTRQEVQQSELHPLNMPRAVMFPTGESKELRSVFLRLKSVREKPVDLTLHLRGSVETGDYSARENLAVATATVPAKKESWVEFPVNCSVEKPYVYVWLPKKDGLSWRLMSTAPRGSCRAYGGDNRPWHVVEGQYYAFFTEPPVAVEAGFQSQNVINGVTRIVDGEYNMWASSPSDSLPQWVQLDFDSPTRFDTVYLTFDTDMNPRWHSTPLVRQCVRDYELSAHVDGNWKPLAQVTGNFQRRRVHRFSPVTATKLRLTVNATNSAPSARVFEIRCYDE